MIDDHEQPCPFQINPIFADFLSRPVLDGFVVVAITLREFQKKLTAGQIELHFARIKMHEMGIMEHGGLLKAIPLDHFYLSVQDSMDAVSAE